MLGFIRLLVFGLVLLAGTAQAQVTPGTSPLSGAKGGTANGFMQFTGPAASLKTYTLPNVSGSLAILSQVQTWTGAQSFTDGTLILLGSGSGSSTIKAPATGGGTATLFAGSDTIAGKLLVNGGTGNALSASNGGVLWSDASKLNILAGTATANLPLLSGSSATPTWATITYPVSATSGGIACFASTSAMGSSVLLTANAIVMGAGVGQCPTPLGSLGTTTTVLHGNASGAPTFGAVSLTTDASGTLQAAQEPAHTGDATNTAGSLAMTVVKINGVSPGPGATAAAGQLPGEPSTGSASAGNVGEYVESVIATGSAVSLSTGAAKTITSISLTAGDWDVDLVGYFNPAASTSITALAVGLSLTTNTLDTTAGRWNQTIMAATVTGVPTSSLGVPRYRLSLSGTNTVFLIASSNFTVSTMSGWGIIRARRGR